MAFDELLVVSNLCLSTGDGAIATDHAPALTDLLHEVRERPSGRRLGVVLNGNTFDFGADGDGATDFEPKRCLERLARILARHEPAIRVLRELLHERDVRLVMVLGNREVQLVLPEAQAWLEAALCGDDPLARRRLILALDGHGLACTVGRAQTLLIHGHEVDPWSHVDFVRLHDHLDACRFAERWHPLWPSPGTRMRSMLLHARRRSGVWLMHMHSELLGVYLMSAHDWTSVFRAIPQMIRIQVDALRKRWSLRRLPTHARVQPPPRIQYGPRASTPSRYEGVVGGARIPSYAPTSPIPPIYWPVSAAQRLEHIRAAVEHAMVIKGSGGEDFDEVVRTDVHLVVHGHWRAPGLWPLRNSDLRACPGFWEPSITLEPAHARDPARFAEAWAALTSDSLDRLAAVDGLLMPRHLVQVQARSDGALVALRQHVPEQHRYDGVASVRLAVEP